MPNLISAKKRMRQSEKRNELNRKKRSAVRTAEKKIVKAVDANKLDEANAAYQTYSSLIDKAAKTNIYHKNTAARKKSRLAKRIAKAQTATPAS